MKRPILAAACLASLVAFAAIPARAQDDHALLQTLDRIAASVEGQGPVAFVQTDAEGTRQNQRDETRFGPRGMDCAFSFHTTLFTDDKTYQELDQRIDLPKVILIELRTFADISGTPTTPEIYAVTTHQDAQNSTFLLFRDKAQAHEVLVGLHRAVAFCGGKTKVVGET